MYAVHSPTVQCTVQSIYRSQVLLAKRCPTFQFSRTLIASLTRRRSITCRRKIIVCICSCLTIKVVCTPASPLNYTLPVDPISAPSNLLYSVNFYFLLYSVNFYFLLYRVNLVELSGTAPESSLAFVLLLQSTLFS